MDWLVIVVVTGIFAALAAIAREPRHGRKRSEDTCNHNDYQPIHKVSAVNKSWRMPHSSRRFPMKPRKGVLLLFWRKKNTDCGGENWASTMRNSSHSVLKPACQVLT